MVFKRKSLLVPFVMLFLLVSSTYARLSIKISEDQVKTICSQVSDHSFCFNFFKSTPQTKTLNLSGVGELLIKYGSRDAADVRNQFKSLATTTTNLQYKADYNECSELYDNAISSFDSALEDLAAKDYDGLNIEASAVVTYGVTCTDDSTGTPIPSPQLNKKISDVHNVADILLVISGLFGK